MTERPFEPSPQVSPSHYLNGYEGRGRWSSYWIQIEEAMKWKGGTLLEVGVGSGTVSTYLREIAGADVTTVDIDPRLSPDVVADIANLPFKDNAFECAMACEVLEHMPYHHSELALVELRRVARHAIVSVPDVSRCFQLQIGSDLRLRSVRVSPPLTPKSSKPRVSDQHYWEMGMANHSEKRFRQSLREAGWNVAADLRNGQYLFHHFFFLE